MSFDTVPPPAHPSITPRTVAALLADQHPELADLPLGPRFDGWDCAMFRLGDSLAVRLPRTQPAVTFLQTEMHWVPQLRGAWEFPSPEFTAHGQPGHGYPWPWAVITWIPGDTADEVPLLADAGAAVGRALAQVHAVAPADAPFNIEQSIPMADRDPKTTERVLRAHESGGPHGERLDTDAALELWSAALAAAPNAEWVWSHADLHGANVLSHAGAFGGIFDWGSMAMCDPAVDVGFTHALMPAAGVEDVLAAYDKETGRVDDAFVARARGIGLSKAVGMALSPREVTQRMAWRTLEALGLVR
ncbi:phosphotransferase [Demequina capsici]|uniref:Phosphotransferase n=1 Tax=Demequina capsici TaxID=3075620 RepID=A0AA96FDY2_9MICO|nr:phosphotransferase [Demequina sp. PMTSA13]WNM27715.1 phosphotransferase [Demequina sp. PMTSA13]